MYGNFHTWQEWAEAAALFYLIFLVILGLPILTMEFSIGRASQKSPVKAYEELEKPGSSLRS